PLWGLVSTQHSFSEKPSSSCNLSLSIGHLLICDSMSSRWLRPEVYPLFAATGVAVGICAFSLIRNITGNPEVRCTKENRAAGVLDNHAEGEKYKENFLRKYVRNKHPEIMPGINKFFTDPKY
ncbi:hypothetical protein HID58_081681, partial [Brassica napus]